MSLASLKIRNKLAVVVGLLVLPLALMSWLFIQQSNKDIDFAVKEVNGRVYLSGVWPALTGLAGAWVNPGGPAAQPLADLAALGKSYDQDLDIGTAGRDLRDALSKLGWPPKAAQIEAQAEGAVAAVRALITKIADGSISPSIPISTAST